MVDLNLHPSGRQLKQFGAIAVVAFSLLGAVVLVRGGLFGQSFGGHSETAAYLAFALGALSGALALVWPEGNRPLFVLLTLLAFPIGFVVSHVALLVLFFGVITPVALFFRIVGRDALERRFDPNAPTYWTDLPEITEKKYYFHQY